MDINIVRNTVGNYFPKLWRPTEACLATVATLMLENNSNPTSLILEGVASSGKGTVLDMLRDLEMIYWSDHFTPKSFVSNYAKKDKKELEGVDLLNRISHKCLVVPDFGVIFGKRADDLRENLGLLTRVLDGQGLSVDTGIHGQRQVVGDCNLAFIGATTPFGYGLWDTMSQFGSRLLFLHLAEDKNLSNLADEFLSVSSYGEEKERCRKVIGQFFNSLWEKNGYRSIKWNNSEMPKDVVQLVANLAVLLTKLRGMIKIWADNDDGFEYKKPIIENPRRVMTLLLNIAKGHAILCGRDQISMEDMPLLLGIVLSSAPEDRCFVLREFLRRERNILNTNDICSTVDVSPKTAIKIMENLKILKLAKETKSGSSKVGRPGNSIELMDDVAACLKSDTVSELFSKIDGDIYAKKDTQSID